MEKLPNSKHCFVCGVENKYGLKLKFFQEKTGSVVVIHTVPDQYQGYPGVVHGGIIASMLDEVLGRVFMSDDHNRFMYTAKMTVRYRKPVPTGKPLKIVGTALKDRGRMAESKAELFGPDGELLAEAEGLLVALPDEVLDTTNLEELGWKVYPDEEKV
jgi:acyl-coenzyme A thioesterase PaaI-like protein